MTPLSTTELLAWMPHRSSMLWIDEVTEVTENAGAASVELKPEGHYMSSDGLRPSSLIEFCAQAYGFVRAAWEHQNKIEAPKQNQVFLAAMGNLEWGQGPLPKSGKLNISVKTTRQMGPLSLCSAQVYAGDQKLISVKLKLFAFVERNSNSGPEQ